MPKTITKTAFRVLITLLALVAASRVSAADANGTEWFSLDGKSVAGGNAPDAQGLVRKFEGPAIGVTRTSLPQSNGTVLLLPGGAYSILDVLNEGARTAQGLNGFGYDVVMLEYHVSSGPRTRDMALEDAQTAWRLVNEKPQLLGIKGGRSIVMGYSAGGHLAAHLVQSMPPNSSRMMWCWFILRISKSTPPMPRRRGYSRPLRLNRDWWRSWRTTIARTG